MPQTLRCPACGAPADDSLQTCPACSAPLPPNTDETRFSGPDPDVTRMADVKPRMNVVSRSKTLTHSSGWSTSTTDIDHGRFQPGAILDDRYRIVGRLGKGGMGEVYRADDLRLGQPVALKFLPESVDRDPARLTQLHTEVRMARQVSHPNVCRVYDVGEYEGHTFLSMEYVDGEDLASLLRRIGRFQEDRAIELSRQICAGLAAAHDRGVVHRDLKPANIMLDGSGRIRITDFGLAGVTGETLRAGTPAYMAPEQLAGGEVTPRSDIYALGLVLYEIFTGKRALEAANVAELIAKREQAAIVPPGDIVRGLDDAIERVVMRCLEPDPARRPSSVLAVSAALPGGDPLAAALAAGETPSPDMVAASGSREALSPGRAIAAAAWIVLAMAACVVLYQRVMLINRVPFPKPPAALVDRAQEIVQKFGYGAEASHAAAGLAISRDWSRFIASTIHTSDRWRLLQTTRPETGILWYRTSPRPLEPIGLNNPVDGLNPPLVVAGMTLVVVDASGRLSEFVAVPPPQPPDAPPAQVAWPVLFEAAGLDMHAFTPTTPRWRPLTFTEQRMAWEGRLPEAPEYPVRVEAAATDGRPVFFEITGPWSQSVRTSALPAAPLFNRVLSTLSALTMPALMIVAAVLARRNVKLGRGDRRGAFRAATAVFGILLIAWLLGDRHASSLAGEIDRLFYAVSQALFAAGELWLAYLGLEPYVRRFSADSLIGWTRLVAGGWRDPRVGRDVMIGVAVGLGMTLVFAVHNLIPPLLGQEEPLGVMSDPTALMTLRYIFALIFDQTQSAMTSAMLGVGGFVVLRILLKRRWLAAVGAVVIYTPVVLSGMFTPGHPLLDVALGLIITTGFVLVIGWMGLLATIAALVTHFVLLRAPLTTDFSGWRGPTSMTLLIVILGLGLGSVYIAASPPRTRPRVS